MGRHRKCWIITAVVCSVIMFFIGAVPKIAAAEMYTVKTSPLAQNELDVLAIQDKESADIYATSSGRDDGLALVGAICLGVLLLCLLVTAIDDESD